ncbi:hypothetical protein [Levilactobacillus phage ENFP1]|nr:hypothetical protein [Levilactobacillus phage ENFP1]
MGDKEGYYYVSFSKSYRNLTSSEVDDFPDFALKKVGNYLNTDLDFIHLEPGKYIDIANGKITNDYVKIGKRYIGRINTSYIMVNENSFSVTFSYLAHKSIPDSAFTGHAKLYKLKKIGTHIKRKNTKTKDKKV